MIPFNRYIASKNKGTIASDKLFGESRLITVVETSMIPVAAFMQFFDGVS